MEWRQRFYKAAISSSTVQLSPLTTASTGCTKDISLPPQLAVLQVSVTTAHATPPTEFWATSGVCTEYDVIIRRIR